jgi:hypothetical protein
VCVRASLPRAAFFASQALASNQWSSLSGGGEETPCAVEVEDCNDGTYAVSFVPAAAGVVLVHVSIQVTPISASPFRVVVYEDDKALHAEDRAHEEPPSPKLLPSAQEEQDGAHRNLVAPAPPADDA